MSARRSLQWRAPAASLGVAGLGAASLEFRAASLIDVRELPA